MTTETTETAQTTENPDAAGISDASYRRAQTRSDALWEKIRTNPSGLRMLTGDRPTGALHIGHYFGSLRNRVRLQQAGVETWLIVADYQVITDREVLGDIRGSVRELITDYLAAGIDPEQATIFTHSAVPALNQLMLPFLSLVTQPELERNPTVKAELAAAGKSAMGGLMLTYPVHQAADILFCHGNLVPVGKDQLPHIEQTRVVARRFNERYAGGEQFFPEPDALLSEAPTILGLDGSHKMSKSLGNTVMLRMSPEETAKKIKKAKTDSEREITFDPENRPEVANLLTIASLSTGRSPEEIAAEIGDKGAGTLKVMTAEVLNEHLAPLRERRAELEKDPGYLFSVLRAGNERANAAADETLAHVREVMGMVY
nr:tryptophan--tRNA ligase [Brachybacterium subflavum]